MSKGIVVTVNGFINNHNPITSPYVHEGEEKNFRKIYLAINPDHPTAANLYHAVDEICQREFGQPDSEAPNPRIGVIAESYTKDGEEFPCDFPGFWSLGINSYMTDKKSGLAAPMKIFDSKLQAIPEEMQSIIGKGSEVNCKIYLSPYKKNKSLWGITAMLNAMQVVSLKRRESGFASAEGFEAVDGFSAMDMVMPEEVAPQPVAPAPVAPKPAAPKPMVPRPPASAFNF
jgi:hypothetical protein